MWWVRGSCREREDKNKNKDKNGDKDKNKSKKKSKSKSKCKSKSNRKDKSKSKSKKSFKRSRIMKRWPGREGRHFVGVSFSFLVLDWVIFFFDGSVVLWGLFFSFSSFYLFCEGLLSDLGQVILLLIIWGLNYSGHFSPHEKIEPIKDGVFITHCRKFGSKLMGREVCGVYRLGQIVWGRSIQLGEMGGWGCIITKLKKSRTNCTGKYQSYGGVGHR